MSFTVVLARGAARDFEELYEYISLHDIPSKADYVLTRIEQAFDSLAESPQRGAHPPELLALGIRDFRAVFFKPYRIVYQVAGETVTVVLIADGRRDLQTLLQRRLLGAS